MVSGSLQELWQLLITAQANYREGMPGIPQQMIDEEISRRKKHMEDMERMQVRCWAHAVPC